MKQSLIYLHGFLSASNAKKSGIFRQYLSKCYPEVELYCPTIDNDPLKAYDSIKEFLSDKLSPSGVIGSSLGGFWARLLARDLNIPAVLLNPVVHPDILIKNWLGEHTNPNTGVVFTLDENTIAGIKTVEPKVDELDRRLLKIYLGTADEVLDYKVALNFFKDCDIKLLHNENHRVFGFADLCPEIANYLLKNKENDNK